MIKSYEDLEVYKKSFDLATRIFHESLGWPAHEQYGLTSQIRNSSRSVAANIAEGWAKREHPRVFKRQLLDAYGSVTETKVWINFAGKCGYINKRKQDKLKQDSDEIAKMLFALMSRWK